MQTYGASLSDPAYTAKAKILGNVISSLLWLIHRAGLAMAYACIFYLLAKRVAFVTLAHLGRMSLSNYILQALIVVPLCLALNLFNRITPSLAFLLAASIWVVQVFFSRWWLKHHRFGPLEWLLRRFTYGKALAAPPAKEPELAL